MWNVERTNVECGKYECGMWNPECGMCESTNVERDTSRIGGNIRLYECMNVECTNVESGLRECANVE